MNTLRLIATIAFAAMFSLPAYALGNFENPVDGSTESGISVISGWHCTSTDIQISIDGVDLGFAGSRTGRPDTTSVCGHAETGFSLLYNWNNLTPGQHVVRALADGVLLGTKTITTIKSAGAQFARGLSRTTVIEGFPTSSQSTRLSWNEAKQSFVVTNAYSNTNTLDGSYKLSRLILQDFTTAIYDTTQSNIDATGSLAVSNSYLDMNVRYTVNGVATPIQGAGYITDHGYYWTTSTGSNVSIIDRGTALVTSNLSYAAGYGYVNLVMVWIKNL